MNKLKDNSIRIESGITVARYPQFGEEEVIDMTDARSKFNGAYCTNNSTICFIVDHEIFVTPYTRTAMETIEREGLVKKCFYVPFSNWDYPKYEEAKWTRLLDAARESRYRDYEHDCTRWAEEHGIGKLSDDILERCFKMPRNGVPVKHLHFEDVYYPACNESCADSTVVMKLGCYCSNNGRVVFIYRDGHTYVAKGYWIIPKLMEAGYREYGLFVPFSNGELITDPYLADQWEKVTKK